MIRAGISLIAAHTNFDIAEGGVNDALAAQLGWRASSGMGSCCASVRPLQAP